jgi:hypothetical protein
MIGGEMAFETTHPDNDQHDGADGDVKPVEAGEQIKGCAVDAAGELEVELGVGMAVFISLESRGRSCPEQWSETTTG